MCSLYFTTLTTLQSAVIVDIVNKSVDVEYNNANRIHSKCKRKIAECKAVILNGFSVLTFPAIHLTLASEAVLSVRLLFP